MEKNRGKYQSALDRIYDWLKEAAENDMLTLVDVVERAKAYLQAAGDLTAQELATMENFLLRDLYRFRDQWLDEADNSIWLDAQKHKVWQLLSDMTDRNTLQLVELEQDIAHHGEYQAGELVALGDLTCRECGHVHQVDFVEAIPPCVECGGTTFIRTPLTD